jgi:hypothetical protein
MSFVHAAQPQHSSIVSQVFMADSSWQGSSPLVFLRPIGIAAGDAMRLMEVAKRMSCPVRWRMAPPGVAADAYMVHQFSIVEAGATVSTHEAHAGASAAPSSQPASSSSSILKSGKLSLDGHGWHRGKPVCVLGRHVDTSALDEDELAPLIFPDALQEMERGLNALMHELVGARMLYAVGALAWEQRTKWPTHRLHAIEKGQLLCVIDTENWEFHLRDGCTVERMADADLVPMPRSGRFSAVGFDTFKFEAALWEFAKRCPEIMLEQMLPSSYMQEPLTHRRAPHLKQNALGDHCVAILRALDTSSRSMDELQIGLRMTRPAVLRAITCLALVRAIQPESRKHRGFKDQLDSWWGRITGKPSNSLLRASTASSAPGRIINASARG